MPTDGVAGTIDLADGPEVIAIRREEAAMVRATLEALSQRQAQALWMRDALGEPVPVVAESLGVTEGSARVLLTRARKQMREGWGRVAAMLPGLGLKLPAPLAKVMTVGGVVPAVVAPALVLVAVAAFVIPGLLDSSGGVGEGLGTAQTPVARTAVPVAVPPLTQVPAVASPTGIAGTTSRAASGAVASSAAGRSGGITIGTPSTKSVTVNHDDPRDDDVTVGDDRFLGAGANLEEELQRVGVPASPLEATQAVVEEMQTSQVQWPQQDQ